VLKLSTDSIDGEKTEAVLGTLRDITCDQFQLSIVLGYDVPTTFSISAKHAEVHLSGYYQPAPEDNEEEDDEDGDGDFGMYQVGSDVAVDVAVAISIAFPCALVRPQLRSDR
jgi:hypothetical protein